MMRNRLIFTVLALFFAMPARAKPACGDLLKIIDTNLETAVVAMDGARMVKQAVIALNQALRVCDSDVPFYKAAAFLWKFRFMSRPFEPCAHKISVNGSATCDPVVVARAGLKKARRPRLKALLVNILLDKSSTALTAASDLAGKKGYYKYVYAKVLLKAGKRKAAEKAFKEAAASAPCLLDAVVYSAKFPSDKADLPILRAFSACPDKKKSWESLKFQDLLEMKPVATTGPRVKWPPTIWQTGPPRKLLRRYFIQLTHAEITNREYKSALLNIFAFLKSLGKPGKKSMARARPVIAEIKHGIPCQIRRKVMKSLKLSKAAKAWSRYIK